MTTTSSVAQHYEARDLVPRLAASLAAAGMADRVLTHQDLSALDHFHARGLQATVDLAAALGVEKGDRVLDIGSGLGGPSRYLAATFGCRVEGIDLSPTFVAAATYLAGRAGLAAKATYRVGNALALPFAAASFDKAWTQHVAMNIADRDTLYAEAARVLRPGGRLAIYDVVQGDTGPVRFPVPWARDPETSFLLDAQEFQSLLRRHGFAIVSWVDRTQDGIDWSDAAAARRFAPSPAPLGLALAMGPDFPAMSANFVVNLRERRVGLIETVVERA